MPWVSQMFPDTPLFFLYRRPIEILLSHRRQRGLQMVPGRIAEDVLGLDSSFEDPADLDGFCLSVITSFSCLARGHAESGDLRLINYTELPDLVWTRFARMFSISIEGEAIERMRRRSSRHSNRPNEAFSEDTNPEMKSLECNAGNQAVQTYHALERLRVARDRWW